MCRGSRTNSITAALIGVALLASLKVPAPSSELPAQRFLEAGSWKLAATHAVGSQFTSSTTVIEVYATVTDKAGKPARGLTQADFEVLEDGTAQRVSNFVAGDFPLRVALALDRSFSVAGRPLEAVKRGARVFLNALRPADESVIITIGSEVTTLADATVSRHQQDAAVQALDAWGTTKLHDAIIQAIDATDAARGRRAVVILSDGDDRYSEATAGAVLERARRANVLIYPVALSKTRPALFAELSSVTGGRSFHVRDLKTLDATLTTIASELREQYLLGYSPARPLTSGTNEWRSIAVRVKRADLTVRARDGYYVK